MDEFNALNIYSGLTAFVVAIVFGALAYKVNTWLTRADEEEALRKGTRAVAIELGAVLVCQAILVRHVVPAVVEVLRTLFVYEVPGGETLALIGRSCLFAAGIFALSMASVHGARALFARLTKKIQEKEEIWEKDNVAVALFHALLLLAFTLVLNEGMRDLARSFVPFGRTGGLS